MSEKGPENLGFNPEVEVRNKKIETIKNKLVEAGFLKPDDQQKDKLSDSLMDIFKGELKHGTKNVAGIQNTIEGFKNKDDSVSENQAKHAEEDIKILSRAVFLAARELSAKDPSLEMEFLLGSKHVDSLLPQELKGLGKEMAKNYISNEQIDKELNLLEITRQNTNYHDKNSVLTLIQKTNVKIDKISKIEFEEEDDIKEQDMVSTRLNEEKLKLQGNYNFVSPEMDEDAVGIMKSPLPMPIFNPENPEEITGYEGGYGPDMETFVRKVLIGTRTDFRDGMPPGWYKKLTREKTKGGMGKERGSMEQLKYRVISDLADDAGTKMMLKDGDLETLATKGRPAMAKEEFKVLYEINDNGSGLPGFKAALEVMVSDLFEFGKDGLLSIRENSEYREKFKNFYEYQLGLAHQLQKNEGLFTEKKLSRTITLDEAEIAIGTAWNFLFIGDIVESADTKRLLNPGKAYGDKVAAMFHPEAKFLRKFRFNSAGGQSRNRDSFKGDEEPYGGSYGEWIYNRITEDNNLYKNILKEGKHIFPERLAMSFVERMEVFALDNGKIEKMSMAKALHGGKTIVTDLNQIEDRGKYKGSELAVMDFDSDANMMIDYRDVYQSAYLMFSCLTGKVKYDQKDPNKWFSEMKTNLALVRQNESPDIGYLKHVDSSDFLKIVIANSIGVKTEITSGLFLDITDDPEIYYTLVNKLLNTNGLVMGPSREKTIKELKNDFHATGILSSMFDLKRSFQDSRRKRSKIIV